MKTEGFRIGAGPFENLAAATWIAAVQVMQMVCDRDGTARRPLEDVFDPADRAAPQAVRAILEGNTARQKNPHRRGSPACAARVRARLGGWTGYCGGSGPVVTLRGLSLFRAMQRGWRLDG